MYSARDTPALRKEALDSSLSLQQLLIWVVVVLVFSVTKELRTRQKVSLFGDAFIRVRKGLLAPPSLPCPCPRLLGLVRSLGGGSVPSPHEPLVPITAVAVAPPPPAWGGTLCWTSQTCTGWTIPEDCVAETNACHLTYSNSS